MVGTLRPAARRGSTPQTGCSTGGLEADTGQQHGVAEKRVQLAEIARPAMGQVDVGIRGDPDRNSRQLHQRGVRGLLAAEHHHRLACPTEPIETAAQQLRRAEYPRHDQVTGLEHLAELSMR